MNLAGHSHAMAKRHKTKNLHVSIPEQELTGHFKRVNKLLLTYILVVNGCRPYSSLRAGTTIVTSISTIGSPSLAATRSLVIRFAGCANLFRTSDSSGNQPHLERNSLSCQPANAEIAVNHRARCLINDLRICGFKVIDKLAQLAGHGTCLAKCAKASGDGLFACVLFLMATSSRGCACA